MTRLLLILALLSPAQAAPPVGADPNSPLGVWLRSLRDVRGVGCCDQADCRRTQVRVTDTGTVEAWIGVEQFGPGAPDEWRTVPGPEVRSRETRPAGVRGAWVCFYQNRIACSDLEGGS